MMTLEEFENSLYNDDDYEEEEVMIGDNLVLLNTKALVSDELGLTIRVGVWCEKNADGEWEGDWGITLLHKTGDDPSNYVYFEQGTILSALHNYAASEGLELHLEYLIAA